MSSSTTTIRRKRKVDNFTRISNDVFRDNVLSFQAMGMLSYLLSKPDNWEVSASHLMKVTQGTEKRTGRDGVYGILNELIKAKFCERVKQGDGSTIYIVQDYPITEKPEEDSLIRESRNTAKPDPAKPTQVTTDLKVTTEVKYSLSEKDQKFSSDDLKLAKWMFEKVQEVTPHAKANLNDWADVIRLMRERDKLTHKVIATVFKFANEDSFWKANILSPTKLREKFAQLDAKMNQSGAQGYGPANQHNQAYGEFADQSKFPEHYRIKPNDAPAVKESLTAIQRSYLHESSQLEDDGEFVREVVGEYSRS